MKLLSVVHHEAIQFKKHIIIDVLNAFDLTCYAGDTTKQKQVNAWMFATNKTVD